MKILIDTDELVEFFGEGWDCYDICSKAELRVFLARFCKQKIEGKEEIDEPEEQANVKADIGMIFDGITYFEKDQAQKHLELLRDAISVKGYVTIRDYYRLAEFLQIIPKWTAMYFTDEYGWKDLSLARINVRHDRGIDLWTLEMPVPEKLDI